MSNLFQIEDELRDAGARIAEAEKLFVESRSRAIRSSLRSLYKLRDQLEGELQEAARHSQVDVLTYRLFEGDERPTMSLLGRALDSFQALYTLLYDVAVSGQPKDRARIGDATTQNSRLYFSHSFAGSVGFVFTVENERLLFGETKLDEAMEQFFDLTAAGDANEIRHHSRRLGLAPVQAAFVWADVLTCSGVGADIAWRKNSQVKRSVILQPAQVRALRDVIDLTSDVEIDERDVSGVMLGYDSRAKRFRFQPDDEDLAMRGTVADAAHIPMPVRIPARYTAGVRTTSQTYYATGKSTLSHELLRLSDG